MSDPYALHDDGTAVDPAAFREALKADPAKIEALQADPEVAAIILGDDEHAFQELIKSVYHVRVRGEARLRAPRAVCDRGSGGRIAGARCLPAGGRGRGG